MNRSPDRSAEPARRSALLLEIEAAHGTAGWGESYGPARPNAVVVEAMTPLLIAADALATEAIWEKGLGVEIDRAALGRFRVN